MFVKKSVGRNKLLAKGLAVYPSPENKLMFVEELRVCCTLILSFISLHIFNSSVSIVDQLIIVIFLPTAVA